MIARQKHLGAVRNDPFVQRIRVRGPSLSSATFAFSIGYPRDGIDGPFPVEEAGTQIYTFPKVVTPAANGVRIVSSSTDAGITTTVIEIVVSKANMSALPPTPEGRQLLRLSYDFEVTTDYERTWLYGNFDVLETASG